MVIAFVNSYRVLCVSISVQYSYCEKLHVFVYVRVAPSVMYVV